MNHASSLQHVDTFLNMCCMVYQLISQSYWSAYRLPTPVSTTTFMAIPFILRQTANLVVWHGLCTDSQLLSHFTLFFQSINIARFASYCSCQEPQHPNSGWNIKSYHWFFFFTLQQKGDMQTSCLLDSKLRWVSSESEVVQSTAPDPLESDFLLFLHAGFWLGQVPTSSSLSWMILAFLPGTVHLPTGSMCPKAIWPQNFW